MQMSSLYQDVENAILSLDEQLRNLQSREQEARNLLQFVLDQQTALRNERKQLERQRHPFRKVPPEILLHIFSSFVDLVNDVSADYDSALNPVVLSHVCRQWRELVLSSSVLWTHVDFGNLHAAKAFMKRSKKQPIGVVCDFQGPLDTSKQQVVQKHLQSSTARWRTLYWSGREDNVLEAIIKALNEQSSFPNLIDLNLVTHYPISGFHISGSCATDFPALEHVRLMHIPLRDLPPVPLPTLRTLELHYPAPRRVFEDERLPSEIPMSEFYPYICRAPNLESLIYTGPFPNMDVRIVSGQSLIPDISVNTRATSPAIRPLTLKKLRSFEWDSAPPKDISQFFHLFSTPALEELTLICSETRPRQARTWLVDNSPAMTRTGESCEFTVLKKLNIECVDTDHIHSWLRDMLFPAIEELSFKNISRSKTDSLLPLPLPRHDSIFREPRLPTLRHLTLIGFQLTKDDITTMLRYLQSLTRLTLEACEGAGDLICMLSGGSCTDGHARARACTPRSWLCPKLERLELFECADVRFKCLAAMIAARKDAEADTPDDGGARKSRYVFGAAAPRPLKPLKRGVAGTAAAADTGANGSLVPGWDPYQMVRPVRIRWVHVDACPDVSEEDAMSLRDEGVDEVLWG